MVIDFNEGWSFTDSHGKEYTVNLPHDAMLTETRDPSCPAGAQSGYFPGGKYVYKKSFSLSNVTVFKKVELLLLYIFQVIRFHRFIGQFLTEKQR